MDKYMMSFSDDGYKYLQLYRHIKNLIVNKLIEDDEKLPSIRELASFLNVNNVTVVNSYKKLEEEGYIITVTGSGTFARKRDGFKNYRKDYSETFKKLSPEMLKKMIDFAGETTSSTLFPVDTFKEVLNEVLDRDGAEALVYQDLLGYSGLRQSISKHFWDDKVNYEDILILSGAQQGIDIASRVLINPGDNIIVEKPTYSGALSVFNWRRAKVFEVRILDDGADLNLFEQLLKRIKIKCFYTMSYFQNPTGATYSTEKKLRILELANKYDFYIIEDDYLSELIYDTSIEYKTFKSLDCNNRVIYIKSFSKIFLPGIRIGYMIPPAIFKDLFQNAKVNSDISTSSLMQRALDLYISKNYWKDHIMFLNKEYKQRYEFLHHCLMSILGDKITYNLPGGGLSFFVKINDNINITSTDLFYECRDKGVLLTPGGIFFKNFEEGNKYFRVGFSQVDEKQMNEGVQILNQIL